MNRKINRAMSFIYSECNTINPFELCDLFGIKVIFKPYNVAAMKGYMVKLDYDNIFIYLNSNLSELSQQIVCAHELGHVLLHENAGNYFHGGDFDKEYEANLFASYLILDQTNYDIKFENMNNYIMQNVIDELIY